jgi:hypothetical protein
MKKSVLFSYFLSTLSVVWFNTFLCNKFPRNNVIDNFLILSAFSKIIWFLLAALVGVGIFKILFREPHSFRLYFKKMILLSFIGLITIELMYFFSLTTFFPRWRYDFVVGIRYSRDPLSFVNTLHPSIDLGGGNNCISPNKKYGLYHDSKRAVPVVYDLHTKKTVFIFPAWALTHIEVFWFDNYTDTDRYLVYSFSDDQDDPIKTYIVDLYTGERLLLAGYIDFSGVPKKEEG